MHVSSTFEIEVRRDLDLPELVETLGLSVAPSALEPARLLHRFGGHRLGYSGCLYRPGELKAKFVPEARKYASDYLLHQSGHGPPSGWQESFSRHRAKASGVLISLSTGEGWEVLRTLAWMEGVGLRPASTYEHLTIASNKDQVGDRHVVPFGGWTQPLAYECVGLLVVTQGTAWRNEGGGGLSRGGGRCAQNICFSAVRV